MAEYPFMPMWWVDYFAATDHLTAEEDAAYFNIIGRMWITPNRSLPNDRAWLQRRFHRWDVDLTLRVLEEFCFLGEDGRWHNKRVDKEWENAKRYAQSTIRKHRQNSGALKNKDLFATNYNYSYNHRDVTNVTSNARARARPFGFDEWWSVYPHKVGKQAARKAYDKAVEITDHDVLVEGVHRYVATKPADRPWCNPATWLNQHRWEDQPQEIRNGNSAHPGGQGRAEAHGQSSGDKPSLTRAVIDGALRGYARKGIGPED